MNGNLVRWLTAFIDSPAGSHEASARFWSHVTDSELSLRRGECAEFATLVPVDGDAYLRVQRVLDGPGGVHLDVQVDDVPAVVRRACALGASVARDGAPPILRSPAGFVFCVARDRRRRRAELSAGSRGGARPR